MKEINQLSQLITYLNRLRKNKNNSILRNRVLDSKISKAQSLLVSLSIQRTDLVLCGE